MPQECEALARAGGGVAGDHAGVVEVWARAVVAETMGRLGETELEALGARVIQVRGHLALDDEQLAVTMPFTDAYESLLRAGLLADLPVVPWLGGRALRFVFEEGI
jgi:hypothetical protein